MVGSGSFIRVVSLAALLAGVAFPVSAQSASVSTADIERLQIAVSDARNDVAQMRARNGSQADRLQSQLDDLSDEVIYLKVRVRKERSVPRSEYSELRDRIDDIRNQARTNGPANSTGSGNGGRWSGTEPVRSGESSGVGATASRRGAPNEIPVGQELDVRIQTPISSDRAQVEDRFDATTMVDLLQGDRVLVPAGSTMRGVVTSVSPATRTDRKGSLTVVFDQLTVNGRNYPIKATVTQAIESEGIKGETGKIATGAGVGAIIGGILGGFKGALAGILIGGGGTIAATEGKDVTLPAGTVLRVRFDSPVTVR